MSGHRRTAASGSRPSLRSLAVATVVALLLTACGGGSDATTSPNPPGPNPPGGPPAPTTGTISGRVTSGVNGAGLDGATVTTQPASSTSTTDTQGNYTISNVSAGSYTVTASRSGYSNASMAVSVIAGQTSTANLALQSTAPPFSYSQAAVIQGPSSGISGLAVSPDGKTIAYGTYGDNSVHIVDVTTRVETRTLTGHTKPVTELAFSPDSRLLATQGTVNLPPVLDGSVRLWDMTTGTQLATVATPGTRDLAFLPNGSALLGASGGDPVSIRVWSVNTLTLTRTISGVFRFAAVSPDGSRVLAGARDDLLHVIDLSTGTQSATWSGHIGWVTAAAYSANGQLVATAGEDRTIQIRSSQTGQTTRSLAGHTSYPDYVAFSPDGAALASFGTGINITRIGNSVSITLGSADRFVRLWNLSSGVEYGRLNTASDLIAGVAFSADWSVLVTSSDAGVIRVFQRSG